MRIDAHHHFWKYDPIQYDWIDNAMSVIRRDCLPDELSREIAAARIDGVVTVQARQSLAETQWLLELANRHDFIQGVVGWVPLISPDVQRDLATFAANPKFKAVRHVLQGEPDPQYMLRDDFNRGIEQLRPFNLAYDILIFEHQLPQAIELVDRHPDQVFILDHIAKPLIRAQAFSPWQHNIRELAKRLNVYCKLSGLVTEADYHAWTPAQLHPYMQTVLDAFTPERLMFGSDWPVCLVASTYQNWLQVVTSFAAKLSPAEQFQILGETAVKAYGLA
ncbi:MAG TPA: amidohydrolase family protein [Tepidisphaeraceae bacterium]|nr:amidohydrolase family protein [Tepidisphaeraceae bacterium]